MQLVRSRTRQSRNRGEDKTIAGIVSLVLKYEPLLEAVSDLYDESDPTRENRGYVLALELVSALAMPQSEVLHAVTHEIGEKSAKRVYNFRALRTH